jgi:hypothetical protein
MRGLEYSVLGDGALCDGLHTVCMPTSCIGEWVSAVLYLLSTGRLKNFRRSGFFLASFLGAGMFRCGVVRGSSHRETLGESGSRRADAPLVL